MIKVFQKRCKHRHTVESHPHCFVDGHPVDGGYSPKNSQYAKALVFDLEKIPSLFALWEPGEQYVSHKNIIQEGCIASYAAKWLYDSKTFSRSLTSKEARERNDKPLLQEFWQLVNEADILIGHNINRYDIPLMNTRFLYHGFPPPMYYRTIDTYSVSGKFKFPSRSMDGINEYLGLSTKMDTNMGLWISCMNGDKDSLQYMETYNVQDVLSNEETYTTLRPWMKSHPELAIYVNSTQGGVCRCGSTNIEPGGFYSTDKARYQAYRCNDCGAIGRFPQNLLAKKKEKVNEGE